MTSVHERAGAAQVPATRGNPNNRVEAPLTLTTEPPRPLGLRDQFVLWINLGISLFGPLTGAAVATATGSLSSAMVAIVVGCALGGILLASSAVFGAATGAPAMVALRGLLGRRGSVLPTVLNLAQNVGWATMEIIVISTAAARVVGVAEEWRWPFAVLGGVVATLMAIRPLGSVRVLRKIVIWLVLAASVYLFVQVLLQPGHPISADQAIGFWPGVDLAVAGVVSFAPLAADYSRHARSRGSAFWGAGLGYGLAAIAYYALGAFAVAHLGATSATMIDALVALPVGAVALLILLVDEVDEAFANIYSTTMSVQNLFGRLDRRWVAIGVGVVATVLSVVVPLGRYQSFLFLIGSVFVPLFAVAAVDFWLVSRGRWDVTSTARFRPAPVLAWLLGFVSYQLVYPGDVPGWSNFWTGLDTLIGFTAPGWLGSSVAAIVVGGTAMIILGLVGRGLERVD